MTGVMLVIIALILLLVLFFQIAILMALRSVIATQDTHEGILGLIHAKLYNSEPLKED